MQARLFPLKFSANSVSRNEIRLFLNQRVIEAQDPKLDAARRESTFDITKGLKSARQWQSKQSPFVTPDTVRTVTLKSGTLNELSAS